MENVRRACVCADLLRRYEGYCYQAAYYLLSEEKEAAAAAKAAMLEIACDEYFAELTEPQRHEKVKRTVSIQSLNRKKMTIAVLSG